MFFVTPEPALQKVKEASTLSGAVRLQDWRNGSYGGRHSIERDCGEDVVDDVAVAGIPEKDGARDVSGAVKRRAMEDISWIALSMLEDGP